MELAFVTRALRRYAWVVLFCIGLGVVPALVLADGGPALYRSQAVLLVAPPTESQFTVNVGGDPDRYVSGQLSVLRSQVMAERVAVRLDDDITARAVGAVVTVSHEARTDVVTVAATTESPERSQEIAEAYVAVYFESIRGQLEATQAPMLEALDLQIEELRTEIAQVDQAMVDVMEPFLTSDPIPGLDQVAPGLISDKQILLAQLTDLQASRTQLRVGPRVASEIVQGATLPQDPLPTIRRTLLVIGAVGGAFLGALAAVAMARFSPNVVTDEQAEEILGVPVFGTMPVVPELATTRRALLQPLEPASSQFVESLCVRAEAANQSATSTLTVVVTGSQRGAGATTVAAMMARRFADGGARVLLVDGDRHDSEMTDLFVHVRETSDPIRSEEGDSRQRVRRVDPTLTGTDLPNLFVSSLVHRVHDDETGQSGLSVRQFDFEAFVQEASPHVDVIVFDGGPLMASVSTVQLVRHCDAIVLSLPRRQSIRGLDIVGSELVDRHVLPVWVPARPASASIRRVMGRRRSRPRRDDGARVPSVGPDNADAVVENQSEPVSPRP
ncbi:MAG: hypothetical protein ACXIVQ_09215 [Acidimicrobiales bacterium]